MNVVIVGGGIVAAYMANRLKELAPRTQVQIISDEAYPPYDRIHLCALVKREKSIDEIKLQLPPSVELILNQPITHIDAAAKKVFSADTQYPYDILVIATGSKPKALFDIEGIENAATFRSAGDSCKIEHNMVGKNVVLLGVGPIGLELLDTLSEMSGPKSITLLSRGNHLYAKELTAQAVQLIEHTFTKSDSRIRIRYNDEIVDRVVEGNRIVRVQTRSETIEDPFIVFGVGIDPNIDFVRHELTCNKGILVDRYMRSSDPHIYAAGEAAELSESGFVAGRVKECTLEADATVASILGFEHEGYVHEVALDGLKVGSFLLADVTAPHYVHKHEENEDIVISSRKERRIDHYIVNNDHLVRFIGLNTNIDLLALKTMIEKNTKVDASFFYDNRLVSERGKLVCSCASTYEQDLIDLIKENAITDFTGLKPFSEAGRVCGRCKQEISRIIEATPVDPEEAARIRAQKERAAREAEMALVQKRIDKYNALHPANPLDTANLDVAIKSFDMNREYNRWVSMITSSMRLHPDYAPLVDQSVAQLNKIPIIWLELSDCTGNSEGFIKAAHPKVDDLILNYISLDYHELLMAASGDQSEHALDAILKNDAGRYILLVEGAVPLGLEGKYLRIGPKGETGLELLRRCAKDAAAVFSIGSCALDGGVVAAAPNPTQAVGVAEALGRADIINLPGCPVNPINIVGTLLHYIMFDELPELDEKNRPKWAYSYRIHDNCERRGHYELEEFVLEWGDEGAKAGWCLFKMGCKGPYADLNCSLVKFNEGTSWPVQAGHGCIACGAGKIAFDKLANHRMVETEES
ncbi:MAG: hydrogenase small subunit [Campylobacterales bacterium]|nr:hydrogenase small subunit [Campylobacterales bacterium]